MSLFFLTNSWYETFYSEIYLVFICFFLLAWEEKNNLDHVIFFFYIIDIYFWSSSQILMLFTQLCIILHKLKHLRYNIHPVLIGPLHKSKIHWQLK